MSEGKDYYKDPEIVKRMARLIAEGASMLSETCPICGLPLFKLKTGETVCPAHGRVWIVTSEAEAEEIEVDYVLRRIEYYAIKRAYEALNSNEPSEIIPWLNIIEVAERIKNLRDNRLKTKMETVEKSEVSKSKSEK
ncbi:MAG: Sjogren's syndrome/scleroderma autoantigen 1 family protein [Acidilobaceae archaeon]